MIYTTEISNFMTLLSPLHAHRLHSAIEVDTANGRPSLEGVQYFPFLCEIESVVAQSNIKLIIINCIIVQHLPFSTLDPTKQYHSA